VNHHLKQIASIVDARQGCVCYALGMGAQPKEVFAQWDGVSGVEVVWSGTVLKGAARMMQNLVASHAGLVKIIDPKKLIKVVETLYAGSMAGVYVFDEVYEAGFVDCVQDNPLPREFDFGIKLDRGYFLYAVDADNAESPTGVFEIVSYGTHAKDFSSIF